MFIIDSVLKSNPWNDLNLRLIQRKINGKLFEKELLLSKF